ncbi:MAG: iron-sulfur cluster assembly scaffold protein [Woeseiaceae bacterium]|nr:iron-sulfur cluster assembly scaffold protein [Woeseiaceae bacterium]
MSADPYSDEVRELFNEPRHAGRLDDGISVREDAQGVRVELSAIAGGGLLTALGFRVWGCPHLIAAAEAVCARFEGREARELEGFRTAQIMEILAIPVEKTGRILVLEDAVRSLGQAVRGRSDEA